MTRTLAGADIRGYYAAIGIDLPVRARVEASIRCFANPDQHHRGDRDPSCSVNLEHGAWHCHACGVRGGAFDAAAIRGYPDRASIDLMVAFGLTEYRAHRPGTRQRQRQRQKPQPEAPSLRSRSRSLLTATEDDVRHWQAALAADASLIGRLTRERGWLYSTILELQLGLDRRRITIPVRDETGRLVGVLRYQPWPRPNEPKMLAVPGSHLGLIPHPATEPDEHLLLVEGPPDMISARSCGASAIAVPGDHAWQPNWAQSLQGRNITIVMDCDPAGRAAADRIARDLARCAAVEVVDLAPGRDDGYDLTDWLVASPRREARPLAASTLAELASANRPPIPTTTHPRHDLD